VAKPGTTITFTNKIIVMIPEKTNKKTEGEKEKAQQPASGTKDEHVEEAYKQAEEDIEHDPDTSVPEPIDDLDEGESVNLEDDDKTALI
jgi:hypothetical protein